MFIIEKFEEYNNKETKPSKFVKMFNYKVIQEEPIENLHLYKHKLKNMMFLTKGTKCVVDSCDKVGTKIVHCEIEHNKKHSMVIVTDDYYPLTVDHIMPKSKGGLDELSNLQPMCYYHNQLKSNDTEGVNITIPMTSIDISYDIEVGDFVYKKYGRGNHLLRPLGVVSSIEPNPHHPNGNISIKIVGNDNSWHSRSSVVKAAK